MSENKASPISVDNSSSELSFETSTNENESGADSKYCGSKSGRKKFVRCKSIDLDDSFNLYKSIINTPRSDSSTRSHENLAEHIKNDLSSNSNCHSNSFEQFQCNDIFKIEGERNSSSNKNSIIDMMKKTKTNNHRGKSTNLELNLLPPPLQKFDLRRTKDHLECGTKATSLPLTPSDGLPPATPSTAPPMYSSVFANVGKCVMMPIDKEYETKYLLMNKMNGINGVNSYIPPGMKVKTEKTFQEQVYLFLEHPSGWLCFFYHMFV